MPHRHPVHEARSRVEHRRRLKESLARADVASALARRALALHGRQRPRKRCRVAPSPEVEDADGDAYMC